MAVFSQIVWGGGEDGGEGGGWGGVGPAALGRAVGWGGGSWQGSAGVGSSEVCWGGSMRAAESCAGCWAAWLPWPRWMWLLGAQTSGLLCSVDCAPVGLSQWFVVTDSWFLYDQQLVVLLCSVGFGQWLGVPLWPMGLSRWFRVAPWSLTRGSHTISSSWSFHNQWTLLSGSRFSCGLWSMAPWPQGPAQQLAVLPQSRLVVPMFPGPALCLALCLQPAVNAPHSIPAPPNAPLLPSSLEAAWIPALGVDGGRWLDLMTSVIFSSLRSSMTADGTKPTDAGAGWKRGGGDFLIIIFSISFVQVAKKQR